MTKELDYSRIDDTLNAERSGLGDTRDKADGAVFEMGHRRTVEETAQLTALAERRRREGNRTPKLEGEYTWIGFIVVIVLALAGLIALLPGLLAGGMP